jgi:hypothetical protein
MMLQMVARYVTIAPSNAGTRRPLGFFEVRMVWGS